ncbi:CoA ester lyase [Fretibacter rubidus]|uniref:HpcH/HpaI aldolase/citrate lyase family protein n=1 Tax=Fretibacter rubidus TaxID=570162 RepID=UPI00352A0E6F
MMHHRSLLFVPGNRPDRFDKACMAGADLVCIDLEDAVGAGDKDSSRTDVLSWLSQSDHKNVSLRINGIDTDAGQADIKALQEADLSLPFVMAPKVDSKSEINDLDDALPSGVGSLFPIIESAQGLENAYDIFNTSRVTMGLFGAVDYGADLDCALSWETLLFARSRLANAAAAADTLLFDVPHIIARDLEDCEATTRQAKALGIHARAAIHPAQIAAIHRALSASTFEIEQAKAIVAAYEKANGNVVIVDGKFIEAPVVKKALRVLAQNES